MKRMHPADRAALVGFAGGITVLGLVLIARYPHQTSIALTGVALIALTLVLPVVLLAGAGWIVYRVAYKRGHADALQAVARAEADRQDRLRSVVRLRSIGGGERS